MRRPDPFLSLLFAVAGVVSPASATVFSVGPAGTAGGCTHTEVQSAIDAAAANPGADEIRLVRNEPPGYSQQALVIEQQDLTLIGGLPDCAGTVTNGRTWLSGEGGTAAPVIAIRGNSTLAMHVRLEGLGLVGGDNEGPDPGGGLSIRARGEFVLANSTVSGNSAPLGAGIGVFGAEGNEATRLIIGDNVNISMNFYTGEESSLGGGVAALGATLSICGSNTVIQWNRAYNGGGLWINGVSTDWPSRLDLCAANPTDRPVLDNNSAVRGGGLQVQAYATARIYTRDSARPLRIARNHASYGGAIDASGRTSLVDLWETHISDNTSTYEGSVFTLFDGATIRVHSAADPNAPLGTAACADHRCNTLINNANYPGNGQGGTIAALATTPTSAPPQLQIDNALITGNRGTSLLSAIQLEAGAATPANIRVRNSAIVANPQTVYGILTTGRSTFFCDLCTIARNSPENGSEFSLINSDGTAHLSRSIVWEPGRDLFAGAPGHLTAHSLLVHDDADLTAQYDIRVGDPRFVDSASDFHLLPDSPALDSATAEEAPSTDLDGNPRERDLVDIPDRLGVVDLGAYERRDNDRLFDDGFE